MKLQLFIIAVSLSGLVACKTQETADDAALKVNRTPGGGAWENLDIQCKQKARHFPKVNSFQMCDATSSKIISCWTSRGNQWHGAVAETCAGQTCVGSGSPTGTIKCLDNPTSDDAGVECNNFVERLAGMNLPNRFQICDSEAKRILSCWKQRGDTWQGAVAETCSGSCAGSGAPGGRVLCLE